MNPLLDIINHRKWIHNLRLTSNTYMNWTHTWIPQSQHPHERLSTTHPSTHTHTQLGGHLPDFALYSIYLLWKMYIIIRNIFLYPFVDTYMYALSYTCTSSSIYCSILLQYWYIHIYIYIYSICLFIYLFIYSFIHLNLFVCLLIYKYTRISQIYRT